MVVVGRQVRSGRPSLLHSLGSYLSWFLIELSWIVPCRELDWIVVQGQVAPESDLTPSSHVGAVLGTLLFVCVEVAVRAASGLTSHGAKEDLVGSLPGQVAQR